MQRIGDYSIAEKIGAGGMGEVWLGENVHTHMRYAIKLLPQEATSEKSFVLRFFDEGRVMAELEHPRIVRVHHVGHDEESGRYYLVMDYVQGPAGKPQSLHNALEQVPERRLAEPQVRKWAVQIAEGLAYTHDRGVVHRDIKPANILIDREGNARITDFGLVKAVGQEFVMSQIHQTIKYTMRGTISDLPTMRMPPKEMGGIEATIGDAPTISKRDSGFSRHSTAESLLGTYDYMSPEQRGGELPGVEVSPASDVYSFGVMLYRVLTGRLPTGLAKPPSQLVSGLVAGWDQVITRCLQYQSSDRYPDARAMLVDLCHIGGNRASAAPLRETQVLAPAAVAVLSAEQMETNRELTRQKMRRWLAKNERAWTRIEWKYFVKVLQGEGFAEALSSKELETMRDEELRTWTRQQESRKTQEIAKAEEHHRLMEEVRETAKATIAEEYRRAVEEAREVEKARITADSLAARAAEEYRYHCARTPLGLSCEAGGLLGQRPALAAWALILLLVIAHMVGLGCAALTVAALEDELDMISWGMGLAAYQLPIALAFWLAIRQFRGRALWILWMMLGAAGWVALSLYAQSQPEARTQTGIFGMEIAGTAWAGFVLALLFRIADRKFFFAALVIFVVLYSGSITLATMALVAGVPIVEQQLPHDDAVRALVLVTCGGGFIGLCHGIAVSAVLVWASHRAKR